MIDLRLGDCLDVLPTLPDASVNVVITDPPYPHVQREYGVWTEAEWWDLIVGGVIPQVRRVLKPTGSAVFILQPNSRKVGSMRGWLFRFQAWACEHWNMVQDAWWWNHNAPPGGGEGNRRGLLRPSVKACVWLGSADCYRDRMSVLMPPSRRHESRMKLYQGHERSGEVKYPSGIGMDDARSSSSSLRNGGVTPFNMIATGHGYGQRSAGAHGHGAGTPAALCNWWLRYLCPPDGTVLDPFVGSGTLPLEALKLGRTAIGIEKRPEYHAIARDRIAAAGAATPLLAGL